MWPTSRPETPPPRPLRTRLSARGQLTKDISRHMAAAQADIEATITSFLDRISKLVPLTPDTPLYADGIGLDSLETAELSAILEDEFGDDPYMADEMPQTVGDILRFFGAAVGG